MTVCQETVTPDCHSNSLRLRILSRGHKSSLCLNPVMQTAFSITEVEYSAKPSSAPGVLLQVRFRIQSNGPSHVAGLIVTTDFWATSHVAPAIFQGAGPGFELWKAEFTAAGPPTTFEFVIFCDDFGGQNIVPRIWNTNGGHRFQVKVGMEV